MIPSGSIVLAFVLGALLCALAVWINNGLSLRETLVGETVLVTGGAQGIGKQVVLRALKLGAKVIVWDRDAAAIEKLEAVLRKDMDHALFVASIVDIAQPASVRSAATQCGPVSMLVNNAGVASVSELGALTDEQILRTFQVNTLSHFSTCKAFLPHMQRANKGHIVTVGSVMGFMGARKLTDYCASKFAVHGFHEALVMELDAYSGISATLICPATTNSRMFSGAASLAFFRTLDVDDVADAIVTELRRAHRTRRVVVLPAIFYLMPLYQLLPMPIKALLTRLTGANTALERVSGTNS